MCFNKLTRSNNIARVTGNPTAQEVWLRTHSLGVLRDYAVLVAAVKDLAQPITHIIDDGDDKGEYLMRKGLPASLRRKLDRLDKLAMDIVGDIESLPSGTGIVHVK